MFTTASKLYFGITVAALAGTVIYGLSSDWDLLGVFLLLSVAIAAGFLGAISLAWRVAVATEVIPGRPRPAADAAPFEVPIVSPSLWPLIGGFGVALVAVGLALDHFIFVAGVVVLSAVAVEWMVQAWADRASDNGTYNAEARSRILNPVEYPILGAISVGVIIACFSRVMLALPKQGSLIVFLVVGALVLTGAFVLAYRPKLSSNAAVTLLLVLGVGVITAGGVGAAIGAREFHPEDPLSEEAKVTNAVADKSNTLANFVVEGGKVTPDSVIVPKATASSFIFRNNDAEPRQLVINGGKTKDGADIVFRSPFIGQGKSAFLTVRLPNSGTFPSSVEGGSAPIPITVVVP